MQQLRSTRVSPFYLGRSRPEKNRLFPAWSGGVLAGYTLRLRVLKRSIVNRSILTASGFLKMGFNLIYF